VLKEILGLLNGNIYLGKQPNCEAKFENLVFHYQAKHSRIFQREKEEETLFLMAFSK